MNLLSSLTAETAKYNLRGTVLKIEKYLKINADL